MLRRDEVWALVCVISRYWVAAMSGLLGIFMTAWGLVSDTHGRTFLALGGVAFYYSVVLAWRDEHRAKQKVEAQIARLPDARASLEVDDRTVWLVVENHGNTGEFYATLEITGSVLGPKRDIFACWAQASGHRLEIAKGGKARLRLATQDQHHEIFTWTVHYCVNDRQLEARATYSYMPQQPEAPIIVSLGITARPDLAGGVMRKPLLSKLAREGG